MSERDTTSERTVHVPAWTPPRWMNAAMKAALHTPGLQSSLGRYGVEVDSEGRGDERDARALLSEVVVIEVTLD